MIFHNKGNYKSYLLDYKIILFSMIGLGIILSVFSYLNKGISNSIIVVLFFSILTFIYLVIASSMLKINKVIQIEFLNRNEILVEFFNKTVKTYKKTLPLNKIHFQYTALKGTRDTRYKITIFYSETRYELYENSDLWERSQLHTINETFLAYSKM